MTTRMRGRNNGDNKPGFSRPLLPAQPVYSSFLAFCLGFSLYLSSTSIPLRGVGRMTYRKSRGCRESTQVSRSTWNPNKCNRFARTRGLCRDYFPPAPRRGSAGGTQGKSYKVMQNITKKDINFFLSKRELHKLPSNVDRVLLFFS